eukprot:COSAG02_NODE_682_length_18523_cov_28.592271_4_plen_85_part_00
MHTRTAESAVPRLHPVAISSARGRTLESVSSAPEALGSHLSQVQSKATVATYTHHVHVLANPCPTLRWLGADHKHNECAVSLGR